MCTTKPKPVGPNRNPLPFEVVAFNERGDILGKICLRSSGCAHEYFKKYQVEAKKPDSEIFEIEINREWHDGSWTRQERWTREPEDQIEGYIVHSVRSVNGNATTCRSVNKTFHEKRGDAVRKARQLADQWSDKHEGVIVFKAIAHVRKVPSRSRHQTRIVVRNFGE